MHASYLPSFPCECCCRRSLTLVVWTPKGEGGRLRHRAHCNQQGQARGASANIEPTGQLYFIQFVCRAYSYFRPTVGRADPLQGDWLFVVVGTGGATGHPSHRRLCGGSRRLQVRPPRCDCVGDPGGPVADDSHATCCLPPTATPLSCGRSGPGPGLGKRCLARAFTFLMRWPSS